VYFAKYDIAGTLFNVGAAAISARPGSPALDSTWTDALIDRTTCDLALRLRIRPHAVELTLFVVTQQPGDVAALLTQLAEHPGAGRSVTVAAERDEFERLVGEGPDFQAWVNHDGFSVAGRSLAADFRLLPLLERIPDVLGSGPFDATYQVNLRRYTPTAEDRRAARRLTSALRLDPPFPAPITDLQCTILQRLLEPGFEADELLAAPDGQTFTQLMAEADRHFTSTMGPYGFQTSPVESGRFDELLTTGLHSSRLVGRVGTLSTAAGVWSNDNVRRLLGSPAPSPQQAAAPASSAAPTAAPPVFLSYSSTDFLQAMATARHLETSGIGCWIAPRNIGAGESYPDAIMRGINDCKILVVLLSDSSNASPQVHREIERALNRDATIIPLRIQNMLPTSSMEYLLATCQWIDAFDPEFDAALCTLTRRIEHLLSI
jgi:TIR domain